MCDLEALRDSIARSLLTGLVTFIISCVLTGLAWLVLYSLGKDTSIQPKKRKYFLLGSTVLFLIIISAYLTIHRQLEAISKTTPRSGNMQADVLGVVPIPPSHVQASTNIFVLTTNPVVATISGIGTNKLEEGGINLIVILRVSNSGQPSTAWNWRVDLKAPNGNLFPAVIPSVAAIAGNFPTIIGEVHIGLENNLLSMFNETSLPTGTAKVGWIPLHINGLNSIEDNSELLIVFDDAFRNPVVLRYRYVKGRQDNAITTFQTYL